MKKVSACTISLESMDGYEFQKFVTSLFKELGFKNVKTGPLGPDGGIDITMEQESDVGLIEFIVECKHHPESSIGRSVVQKLHSAVAHTPNLDKGIIVTSGHFSRQAHKYAEEVGIELINIEKLKELAKKAKISLEMKDTLLIDNCFPLPEKSKIISNFLDFLLNDLKGLNTDAFKMEALKLRLLSSYMIDYTIDATFSTSVGIIHTINETSVIFLENGGQRIDTSITEPLLPLRQKITALTDREIKGIELEEKDEFTLNNKEVKGKAIQVLRNIHTTNVSYYGANNRRYTKTCTPRKKDITINDIERVYLPILMYFFSILSKKYVTIGVEGVQGTYIIPTQMFAVYGDSGFEKYPVNCNICSEIMDNKFVCNECGVIVCKRHKSECKVCKNFFCKNHIISKRKFLILSDKYCSKCAIKEGITTSAQ